MIRFFKSAAFKMFAVIAAALLAGSLFAVVSRNGSSPLTRAASVVFGPLSRLSSRAAAELSSLPFSFKSSSVLAGRIKELEEREAYLSERLVDYENLRHKNEFYRRFLGVKEERPDFVFAEAAIIGRDAADRLGSFSLNRGSANGVSVNDPVIYGKYLVGVVSSVTPSQCVVDTIVNPKVNVGAYEVRTRVLGYVSSTLELSLEGLCRMPGLPSATAITAGGVVCSSGVGGIFPRGLIIGSVVDVVDGSVDISASAIIKPGVDFSKITDVFIITSFDGQTNGEGPSDGKK